MKLLIVYAGIFLISLNVCMSQDFSLENLIEYSHLTKDRNLIIQLPDMDTMTIGIDKKNSITNIGFTNRTIIKKGILHQSKNRTSIYLITNSNSATSDGLNINTTDSFFIQNSMGNHFELSVDKYKNSKMDMHYFNSPKKYFSQDFYCYSDSNSNRRVMIGHRFIKGSEAVYYSFESSENIYKRIVWQKQKIRSVSKIKDDTTYRIFYYKNANIERIDTTVWPVVDICHDSSSVFGNRTNLSLHIVLLRKNGSLKWDYSQKLDQSETISISYRRNGNLKKKEIHGQCFNSGYFYYYDRNMKVRKCIHYEFDKSRHREIKKRIPIEEI